MTEDDAMCLRASRLQPPGAQGADERRVMRDAVSA
jgi:hypothetical protein